MPFLPICEFSVATSFFVVSVLYVPYELSPTTDPCWVMGGASCENPNYITPFLFYKRCNGQTKYGSQRG